MADPEIREFRKHLRAIERSVANRLKEETMCCGVTLAQCHALIEISEAGKASIVDLAQQLGLDTSTLSRTVDSLVKAGYVTRETDPANRRYVQLRLTDAGNGKVVSINDACDHFYTEMLRRIPKSKKPVLGEAIKLLAALLDGTAGAKCEPGSCCAPKTAHKRRNRHGKNG